MAGLRCAVPFSGISLAAGVGKTVVQLKAPSNQRVKLSAIRLGFNGVVTTDGPIKVQVYHQSAAGTPGGGGTPTPVKLERSLSETPQTTAVTAPTGSAWSAEPTAGDLQYNNRCHPQGAVSENYYLATEIWIKGGEWCGIFLTAPQANSVDGEIYFEE